jgi:hypothetical protein
MFNRPISDGLPISNSSSPNSVVRADLALGAAASGSVELPERAVTETNVVLRVPGDQDRFNEDVRSTDLVRSSFLAIQQSKDDLKRLDAIRAKLMPSYKAIGDQEIDFVSIRSVSNDIVKNIDASNAHISRMMKNGLQNVYEQPKLSKNSADPSDLVAKRERVLQEIADVMIHIDALQSEVSSIETNIYDRLLDMNFVIKSLNDARTQADSEFGVIAASRAVDNIVFNVRSAVVAHGNVSQESVRLALIV